MIINISSNSYVQEAISMAKPYTALIEIPMTNETSYTIKNTIPGFIPLSIRVFNNTQSYFYLKQQGFYFEYSFSPMQSKIVNLVGVEEGSYVFTTHQPTPMGVIYVELSNFKDYPNEDPVNVNVASSPFHPIYVNLTGYSGNYPIPVYFQYPPVVYSEEYGYAFENNLDSITVVNNASNTVSATYSPLTELVIYQTTNVPGVEVYLIGLGLNGISKTLNLTSFSHVQIPGNTAWYGRSYTFSVVSQSSATSGTYIGNIIIN